jgi:hypothetical protein
MDYEIDFEGRVMISADSLEEAMDKAWGIQISAEDLVDYEIKSMEES